MIEFELTRGPDRHNGDGQKGDDQNGDGQGAKAADALTRRFHTLPSVEAVRRDASVWQLTAVSLQASLPALLQMAEEERLGLHQLTSHSATLEDVFVSLTGRHLRDE